MIDIQNKTNMLNRGHIVVQLRGHSSCVVTGRKLTTLPYATLSVAKGINHSLPSATYSSSATNEEA